MTSPFVSFTKKCMQNIYAILPYTYMVRKFISFFVILNIPVLFAYFFRFTSDYDFNITRCSLLPLDFKNEIIFPA